MCTGTTICFLEISDKFVSIVKHKCNNHRNDQVSQDWIKVCLLHGKTSSRGLGSDGFLVWIGKWPRARWYQLVWLLVVVCSLPLNQYRYKNNRNVFLLSVTDKSDKYISCLLRTSGNVKMYKRVYALKLNYIRGMYSKF